MSRAHGRAGAAPRLFDGVCSKLLGGVHRDLRIGGYVEIKNKNAVILINLGTPSAPTPKAVRQFLKDFLGDKRVVEIPRLVWWPILYGFILPFRPRRVAKLYQEIWGPEGSPLRVITERQTTALSQLLADELGENAPSVTSAMVYGGPSIESRVDAVRTQGAARILLLPLYPQYSATTTGSVYDQYARVLQKNRNIPNMTVYRDYHRRPDYIEALARSVEAHWQEKGRGGRLLLSYHGIPQRNVDLGDPYYDQCATTARLLAERLGLTSSQWAMSFQSRLGKAQWLQPYTDKLLQSWGKEGVNSVDVICPAFSADCLETIEEIDGENRAIFLAAGGERFEYIGCLNDRPDHIAMMGNIVREFFGVI